MRGHRKKLPALFLAVFPLAAPGGAAENIRVAPVPGELAAPALPGNALGGANGENALQPPPGGIGPLELPQGIQASGMTAAFPEALPGAAQEAAPLSAAESQAPAPAAQVLASESAPVGERFQTAAKAVQGIQQDPGMQSLRSSPMRSSGKYFDHSAPGGVGERPFDTGLLVELADGTVVLGRGPYVSGQGHQDIHEAIEAQTGRKIARIIWGGELEPGPEVRPFHRANETSGMVKRLGIPNDVTVLPRYFPAQFRGTRLERFDPESPHLRPEINIGGQNVRHEIMDAFNGLLLVAHYLKQGKTAAAAMEDAGAARPLVIVQGFISALEGDGRGADLPLQIARALLDRLNGGDPLRMEEIAALNDNLIRIARGANHHPDPGAIKIAYAPSAAEELPAGRLPAHQPGSIEYAEPVRLELGGGSSLGIRGAKTLELLSSDDLARLYPGLAKRIALPGDEYILLNPSNPGAEFQGLPAQGSIDLGRDIPGPFLWPQTVSRRHLRIETAGGKIIITDLGSKYGSLRVPSARFETPAEPKLEGSPDPAPPPLADLSKQLNLTQSQLKRLSERLPQGRRTVDGSGQIPAYSRIRQVGSEDLVVLQSEDFDPVLMRWLARTKDKSRLIEDPLSKAKKISDEVAAVFKHAGSLIAHPIKHWRFNQLTKQDYAKLGDLMRNRTGVCRHAAALLQIALQRENINSRIVYGKVEERYAKDGEAYAPAIAHAWVEVDLPNGDRYLLDPSLGLYGMLRAASKNRVILRKGSFFSEDTNVTYAPDGPSAITGPAELSKDDFEDYGI